MHVLPIVAAAAQAFAVVLRRLPQHSFARVVLSAIVPIGVLLFFRRR